MLLLRIVLGCSLLWLPLNRFVGQPRVAAVGVIVRQQFGNIADEIVEKLRLVPQHPGRVLVLVEGEPMKTAVENAFVEALTNRGYRTIVSPDRDSTVPTLHVLLLGNVLTYKELGPQLFERTIRSTAEARIDQNGTGPLLLGTFARTTVDTTSYKEELPGLARKVEQGEEAGVFERILGPLIVLAGSVVIVYLFFTVRS